MNNSTKYAEIYLFGMNVYTVFEKIKNTTWQTCVFIFSHTIQEINFKPAIKFITIMIKYRNRYKVFKIKIFHFTEIYYATDIIKVSVK